jgi:chemotaxis regulatin CheY-phosphate phosphatase CheZ
VELERTLAHFSKLAGDRPADEPDPAAKQASDSHGSGPAIPGAGADAVGEQGDVDALLAMMGM